MYHDDFYEYFSEFDRQIEEFKQSLIDSVKQEHKDEIKELREENDRLQYISEHEEKIKREHKQAIYQMEVDKKDFEKRLSKMRLAELLNDNMLSGWHPALKYLKKPKCNRCDEKRRIYYTTPSGRQDYEMCECSNTSRIYMSEEIKCYKIYQSKKSYRGEYPDILLYFSRGEDKDGDSFEKYRTFYKDEPFESIDRNTVIFSDKEDCLKYCTWLNK